jgi:DNA-binding MarR family transcriptional regulator
MENFSERLRDFIQTIGRAGEFRFETSGMPINLKQHFILTMLSKSEEVFQTVLAEILRKDKSAVLREIDALESLGLVLRVGDASDRRKKRILMTDAGKEMFQRGQTIVLGLMSDLTHGISPEEVEIFTSTMARMTQNGMALTDPNFCLPK